MWHVCVISYSFPSYTYFILSHQSFIKNRDHHLGFYLPREVSKSAPATAMCQDQSDVDQDSRDDDKLTNCRALDF